jgi:hypothetical protein
MIKILSAPFFYYIFLHLSLIFHRIFLLFLTLFPTILYTPFPEKAKVFFLNFLKGLILYFMTAFQLLWKETVIHNFYIARGQAPCTSSSLSAPPKSLLRPLRVRGFSVNRPLLPAGQAEPNASVLATRVDVGPMGNPATVPTVVPAAIPYHPARAGGWTAGVLLGSSTAVASIPVPQHHSRSYHKAQAHLPLYPQQCEFYAYV